MKKIFKWAQDQTATFVKAIKFEKCNEAFRYLYGSKVFVNIFILVEQLTLFYVLARY